MGCIKNFISCALRSHVVFVQLNFLEMNTGRIGSQVVVPYRCDPYYIMFMKPMADLGQFFFMVYWLLHRHTSCTLKYSSTDDDILIVKYFFLPLMQEWNPRNKDTIMKAIEHSNVVINLVGKEYETRWGEGQTITFKKKKRERETTVS